MNVQGREKRKSIPKTWSSYAPSNTSQISLEIIFSKFITPQFRKKQPRIKVSILKGKKQMRYTL